MSLSANLSENVRRLREEQGLTWKELAERCGRDKNNIQRSLQHDPKLSTVEALAAALAVDPLTLLRENDR